MRTANINQKREPLIKLLGPRLEKFGGQATAWVIALLVIIAIGLYGLYQQIMIGHIVTGMRDHVVWGFFIANFVYFIGISYSCAILAATLYYFKVDWGRAVIRISSITALSFAIIGPIFILLCIGRFDQIHQLFINARIQSPITWDVMVISTYLVGILLFVYLLLIRDLAILRDSKLNFAPWRRKLYTFLALGYKGNNTQSERLDKSTRSMSMIMVPKVILAFAVLSWIFGMTLRPGWHSTIFGPSFITSSISAGIALVIVILWYYRKIRGLEAYITDDIFVKLAYILALLTLVFGYFTVSEYVTVWYSSETWDARLMDKLFSFSEYGWWFHLTNFFTIVLPLIVILIPKFRRPRIIAFASLLLFFAMWVKRYLIVVPTLETTLIPIQDIRPEYVHYSPTWVEWALTFAGVASFFLIFTIMTKITPILPLSEFNSSTPKEQSHE